MPRTSRATVWLFLAPALAFYLAFVVAPIFQSFVVSLFDWPTNAVPPTRFAGLENYVRLVHDGIFWKALAHNVILLVLSLVIQLPLALALAALLSGRIFARAFFRTVYFAPMILPSVVVALVWEQMYMPAVADGLIVKLLGSLGLPPPENGFLGDPRFALGALVLTISWRYVGFHMVLFMAGIEMISDDLYEAARIDGAGPWHLFRYITLPSLAPVVRISAVLSIVGSLKYFDLVYIMTRGGPPEHATELMTTYMYQIGIDRYNGGYGSAVAVGGFLVSMLVVAVVMGMRWHRRAAPAEEVRP